MSPNASLVTRDSLSFSATRCEKETQYYELAWCKAEEVALYASLIVGAHPRHGKIFPFPTYWAYQLEDHGQDLSAPDVIEEVGGFLRAELASRSTTTSIPFDWEQMPPFVTGRSYHFHSLVLPSGYQQYLLSSIDPQNVLLVRGLAHLIKSGMLTNLGRAFVDTACLEIYVALETTLEIILDRLRSAGNKNPSNRDASDFLPKI